MRLSKASLGSTFFCLDLDWITNKGLSIRRETANCGGWTPTSTGPVQNGRCEPPNFLDHDSSGTKKNTPKVFIKWCCVAVTKTCDFAGLGVFCLFLFCSKNFTHQLLLENSDICLVFYVFFRPNEDKINSWQIDLKSMQQKVGRSRMVGDSIAYVLRHNPSSDDPRLPITDS